jgi:outer membrane lipoprotein LolB
MSVSACTTLHKPATSPQSAARMDNGQPLAGRMVVSVAEHGADVARTLSAHFELRGHTQRGALDLSTPLGSLLAQAHWAPEGAWLRTPKGETRFANLDALTHQMLGETLPLWALFDWLRGQPWPGAPYQRLNDAHPTTDSGFTQIGWRIDLSLWNKSVVVATRAQAPLVTVRAQLERP